MIHNTADVKLLVEAAGLFVFGIRTDSIFIASSRTESDGDFDEDGYGGIRCYSGECGLFRTPEGWLARYPKYQRVYDVPGTLDELVPLILSVYAHHKQHSGELYEAFEQVVADAERYLAGGIPATV